MHLPYPLRDGCLRCLEEVVHIWNVWAQPAHLVVGGNEFPTLQRRTYRVSAVDDQDIRATLCDISRRRTSSGTSADDYRIPVGADVGHVLKSGATVSVWRPLPRGRALCSVEADLPPREHGRRDSR